MNWPEDYIGEVIQGDCREVLKQMPNECVDLIITSPPYDNLREYKSGPGSFVFNGMPKEFLRIIKKGGVVVWVVGDQTINGSESGTSFIQALAFMECGFSLHDTMIYQKNGPAYPAQNKYYQIFEYMFVFSKGKLKTFNPIKDRKNRWYGQKWSKKRTRRQVDGELKEGPWYAQEQGEYGVRFNIWNYYTGAGYSTKDEIAFKHPAIFPEALARDHILSWSNEGDLILDPMCGSGTTCKMAMLSGRNFIGIEIEPEYAELAETRLKPFRNQLKLALK